MLIIFIDDCYFIIMLGVSITKVLPFTLKLKLIIALLHNYEIGYSIGFIMPMSLIFEDISTQEVIIIIINFNKSFQEIQC